MGSATPITFASLELALQRAGALPETAEAHGHLCGLICLLGVDAAVQWPVQILEGAQNALSADAMTVQVLQGVARDTCAALEAGDLSFALTLPADERPLAERADSLAHWCHGFLHGIALATGGHLESAPALRTDVGREILRDFGEISRAAFAAEETETEAETAYTEIVEYVRVSVQFLFEELHRVRSGAAAAR
jgi:uncharacterized protein YgfB (UPF0149 family)